MTAVHLLVSLALVFLPFYFEWLVTSIIQLFHPDLLKGGAVATIITVSQRTISILVAILAGLNFVKEFMLARGQLVEASLKRELVTHVLNFLMDFYGWEGTCRATLFVLSSDRKKLQPFDRLVAGKGPEHFGNAFFTMNQGIPGKAWAKAWKGENLEGLTDAIQVGTVPPQVLKNDAELREFFKQAFGVIDDAIYQSLGEKKRQIQSYMAVGLIGSYPYQSLSCMLVIDSEDEASFADFERLKLAGQSTMMTEQQGMAIVERRGQGEESEFMLPEDFLENLPDLAKQFLQGKNIKDTSEATNKLKRLSCGWHLATMGSAPIRGQYFIWPLGWALKQVSAALTLY